MFSKLLSINPQGPVGRGYFVKKSKGIQLPGLGLPHKK